MSLRSITSRTIAETRPPITSHLVRRPGLSGLALLMTVLAGALTGSLSSSLSAQTDSIYPTYEGWTGNDDGTYTLVFGYHSANAVPVEIPVGEANRFLQGEPDRNQPTVFLPGRQRNVCRMVVPANFRGNLQWQITHAGTATSTTDKGGLDALYTLERIGSAYRSTRDLDTATVPKSTCINRAPSVFLARELQALTGKAVELEPTLIDDGLPRDGEVAASWSKISGPGEATIESGLRGRAVVTFSVSGDYTLELQATDGEETTTRQVRISVAE